MTGPHPDNPLLQALLDGTLTEAQQAGLESRLSAEPDLRDRLDALTSASDFSATFIPPEPTAPAAAAELTALIETLHASTPDTIPPPRDHTFDPTTHLAPPRNDDAIGSLGDYDILEIVGQGGMGIVFRAYDPLLQRPVAIKALSPALATSPAAREQFLREARSAAALDHSHILPIHAVDQQGILPY
ncbi:MAG: hypothetical protein P8J87_06285, partial [Verrucomicrobiales bacterium]|nr:hypothetical protein [Verrucomicrobiales bacterium]